MPGRPTREFINEAVSMACTFETRETRADKTLAGYRRLPPEKRNLFKSRMSRLLEAIYDRFPDAQDAGHLDLLLRYKDSLNEGDENLLDAVSNPLQKLSKRDADALLDRTFLRSRQALALGPDRFLEWHRNYTNSSAIEPGSQRNSTSRSTLEAE